MVLGNTARRTRNILEHNSKSNFYNFLRTLDQKSEYEEEEEESPFTEAKPKATTMSEEQATPAFKSTTKSIIKMTTKVTKAMHENKIVSSTAENIIEVINDTRKEVNVTTITCTPPGN